MNQSYNNTKVTYWHLGGSYPSAEIDQQAKGDTVYSGVLGYFIGNNPNAKEVEGLSFGEAHSDANQNINNLKYIYISSNKEGNEKLNKTRNILNKVYPNNNSREFNKVSEVLK